MRAVCISESYCQYKTDTGYCGYTGMGCAKSLVRSVKYDPKVSLVHQVGLTDDCIDQIAEAVAKKLMDNAVNMIMTYCPTNGEVYKPTLTMWSCDRNICKQNEYRGIDCDECEITKHNKIVMDEAEE